MTAFEKENLNFILGAQKCATTTLHDLLSQFPDICCTEPKEPQFFSQNFDKGLDWYAGHFARPNAEILLDASTGYTMADFARLQSNTANLAPRRIFEFCPAAKFIYVVRDPMERTWSALWHDVRAGRRPPPKTVAIEDLEPYVATSCYSFQLERYFEYFPKNRFLVVSFEKLKSAPSEVVERCYEFLGGAAGNITVDVATPKNRSTQSTGMGRLYEAMPIPSELKRNIEKAALSILPDQAYEFLRSILLKPVPKLSHQIRRELEGRFVEDQQRLATLLSEGEVVSIEK